jgi:hypothetical protein
VILVTIDTNILSADNLVAAVPPGKFEFVVVSVTDREVGSGLSAFGQVVEAGVLGESLWGKAVWPDSADSDCLEQVLAIVSARSFPQRGLRGSLTAGQRRQLRDAMIFCAHVRAGRHIFVTNDKRGFIRDGRRQQLEQMFATRIMTREEFEGEFAS